jgi:hypothetical protein
VSEKSVVAYIAMKLAGCFVIATSIYMQQHGVEYWGWVLAAGIFAAL